MHRGAQPDSVTSAWIQRTLTSRKAIERCEAELLEVFSLTSMSAQTWWSAVSAMLEYPPSRYVALSPRKGCLGEGRPYPQAHPRPVVVRSW